MHNAITTKYLTPTSTQGSRIQARMIGHQSGAQKVTLNYDYGLSVSENHLSAALALHSELMRCNMAPPGTLHGGALGNDYVWVLTAS